jgi:hypothetical protein
MNYPVLIAIVVILAVLLVVAIVVGRRKHRTTHLRNQFGSEYDRALQKHGNASRAEAELADREARVHKLSIRELPAAERNAFVTEWSAVQRRFVDDPSIAVSEADRLVTRVMTARGYPMGEFEQRANDISVDHPGVVQSYRSARDIVVRHGNGNATTEDLRQAMVYYHSLFDELLGLNGNSGSPVVEHETVLRRAS